MSGFRTAAYIEHANQEVGVTPSGRQVAEQFIRQCDALGAVEVGAGLRRALDEVSIKSVGSRCVRKWGKKITRRGGSVLVSFQFVSPCQMQMFKTRLLCGYTSGTCISSVDYRNAPDILSLQTSQNQTKSFWKSPRYA